MKSPLARSGYRRSLAERLTNLTLAGVFLAIAVVLMAFSGPFWPLYGAWGSLLAVLSSLAMVARWISSRELVGWKDTDLGPALVREAWARRTELLLADLTAVNVVPCSMVTTLQTPTQRMALSHKLLQFEVLLSRLRSARPDLFPLPTGEVRLGTTRVGLLTLTAFAIGTAISGLILGQYQAWMMPFFEAAAVVPLVRIVFFFPLEYRILPGKLVIRFAARRKLIDARHLTLLKPDVYAAGGAVFFLLRLEFPEGNVILDEGHLRHPLRPVADWIANALI